MEDAFEIMSRAHHNGRAVVTIASRDEAERVAGVLREIGLGVQVDRV
jgi:ATP-dependent Clp protease adapter protein ClpS